MLKFRIRQRLWTFIFYTEHGTLDELETFLKNKHLNYIISPYHNLDKTDEGELKKPHHHVLIGFENAVGTRYVQANVTDVLCTVFPEPCLNFTNLVRYFTHVDSKEDDESKHRYDWHDMRFSWKNKTWQDIQDICEDNAISKSSLLVEYVLDNHFTNFTDLSRHLVAIGNEAWLKDFKRNAYFYSKLTESNYQDKKFEEKSKKKLDNILNEL